MNRKEELLQNCIVLDTETTSDNYKIAEIIESGFVIRENNEWIIFQELHKPSKSIPPKISSITYIIDDIVTDKLPFSDTKDAFQKVIDGFKDKFVVAHNYFYDMKVLQNHGIIPPNKSICTLRIARKLFNEVTEIEETNLPYLRFALDLGVPIEMKCHRAGNDSFITAKLLEVFVDLMEQSGILNADEPYGEQIVEWCKEPIIYSRMPFGKHKNELMTDIPISYWKWCIQNMDTLNETADNYDPDLAASIHKALGLD